MSLPPPSSDRRGDSIAGPVLFALALAVSLFCVRAGWHGRMSDTHPFRQTQTALSTYWMLRDGIRLDYSTPVMGAPWSIPMEFPLYQAAVTLVVRVTGLSLESAARTVSLVFFYASLPALWLLLRRLLVPAGQAWLFLALVVACPVYLFYSRAILVESTAFCFGAWFLYAFHVSLHSRHAGDLMVAALFGITAGLVKITTFAVFLAAATALGLAAIAARRTSWRTLLARGAMAALPGVIAGAAWVAYADAIKRRNVLGVMMTSAEQRDWNYGAWDLRFTPAFWSTLLGHLRDAIAPAGVLLLCAVLALLFLRRTWRVPVALGLVALSGPVVFANLYLVHDYYLYANGIFFLALLAWPLAQVFRHPEVGGVARWGTAALVVFAEFLGYFGHYYRRQADASTTAPEIALALKQVTHPDDVVLGFGMNWSSILPYFSERRALMIPDRYIRDDATIQRAIDRVGAARLSTVVLFRNGQPGPEFYLPWVRKLGMDENPFLQTGEFTIHIRKDREPEALKALAQFPFKDVLLYQGTLGPAGQKPPVIYWVDQLPDRKIFAMMTPTPIRVMVPFGLGDEVLGGRTVFTAHSTSEVEIPVPANARHIVAEYGLNPAVYDRSDGIVVEVINASAQSGRIELFRKYLRPGTIKGDQGTQTIDLETTAPLTGTVLFRILPGGGPNFDWAYWARIEIR